MFGDRYLVAPVLAPGLRERQVYVPTGAWRNVDTGETVSGGQIITVPAPIELIPVLEKCD